MVRKVAGAFSYMIFGGVGLVLLMVLIFEIHHRARDIPMFARFFGDKGSDAIVGEYNKLWVSFAHLHESLVACLL